MKKILIMCQLKPGTIQRHLIKFPRAAFAKDEPRPIIVITGAKPEALVPLVICRSDAGLADSKARDVAARSKDMALAFELPYVLTVSKPVQPGKGHRAGAGGLSSYAAAAEKGVPSILAEAGGLGQMQEDAVVLLVQGVINVMRHVDMFNDDKVESH